MKTDNRPLSITVVHDKKDLEEFIGMTRGLYAGDPNFVQPLTFERLEHLDPKKNPALRHMETAYWTVRRGREIVGRISCQINALHIERHKDATAHFGFFEATDDPEVIELLLDTAEIWARERGMKRLQGPFTLSINEESGLLHEGFDTPPYMMMPHGKPYYSARLEELGYRKAKDLLAFHFDVTVPWPKNAGRLLERTRSMRGLHVRPLDFKRYDEEIALICDIFNDAWADNWNFIPFDEEAARHMGRAIRPLVNPNCFSIAEFDGRPVAMAVTLPDINSAIADLDGRLFPFGFAKLLWRLKVQGLKRWRVPLVGIRKEVQGSLKGAAAVLGVIDAIRTYHMGKGVTEGELSWLLEDNLPIIDVVTTVGGTPYKTYRVFERDIV
ncbi:MAG: dATP pyrophosphohydrolase [Geminicoccaceae bacterium]